MKVRRLLPNVRADGPFSVIPHDHLAFTPAATKQESKSVEKNGVRIEDIDEAVSRYRVPAPSRKGLQKIKAHASDLLQELGLLSDEDEMAICGSGPLSHLTGTPAIKRTLGQLINRCNRALQQMAGRRSGRKQSPRDRYRQFIGELGILWATKHPTDKGVKKVDGKPKGQMVDFVYSVRNSQRIKAPDSQSYEALGESLYKLRQRIRYAANMERGKAMKQKKLVP
jgi:hypothetical protein